MKLILTLVLFSFGVSTFGQTNWAAIESRLTQQREQFKITSDEWYYKLKKEAGHFGYLSLWVKSEEQLNKRDNLGKLRLYFPEKFQVETPNGNKYANLYLENNTKDSIDISRIDATLANVQEYFFIQDKWVPFRKSRTSTCGNSYFEVKLAPHHQLLLQLNDDALIEGKNKVQYKITITLNNQIIESNPIILYLHDSQIKRMTEAAIKSE